MSKLLVVDDDLALLKVLRDWLVHTGFEVSAASNGTTAWDEMKTQSHDLIVLDWDLPDTTGLELLSKFRETGSVTPVIMLTGRRSVNDKTAGLDAGADDYLTKPFHLKELTSRIKALLRKAERNSMIPSVPKPLGVGNHEVLGEGDLFGTSLAARYEFREIIGSGGVGVVFKALHPQLQRTVAVKMLQKSAFDSEVAARFEQEARMICRLEHPNIANVYDYGTTERGRPFMVLEFVEGMHLGELIKEKGALPFDLVVQIACQVADGLAFAHKCGVVHRDVKPSNIMLKTNAEQKLIVKVLDFGCAKQNALTPEEAVAVGECGTVAPALNNSAPTLTQAGTVVGTPYYMSPEQALGKSVNHRADVYALGCILYEMLTAAVPHVGMSNKEVLIKHVRDEPLPLAARRNDLPGEFQNVVNKALSKKPDHRYQSMLEFKAALEAINLATGSRNSGIWERIKMGIGQGPRQDDKKSSP